MSVTVYWVSPVLWALPAVPSITCSPLTGVLTMTPGRFPSMTWTSTAEMGIALKPAIALVNGVVLKIGDRIEFNDQLD